MYLVITLLSMARQELFPVPRADLKESIAMQAFTDAGNVITTMFLMAHKITYVMRVAVKNN